MNAGAGWMGFELTRKGNGLRYVFPTSWYPGNVLAQALASSSAALSYELTPLDPGRTALALESPASDWEDEVAGLFAAVNGLPAFSADTSSGHRNARRPLVSCIVLLTANDLFASRTLIPSIIASSRAVPLEIIVVYNGHGCDLGLFPNVSVYRSPFGCVSRGYNQGVAKARGEYVAIFHDDCVMDDGSWLEKAIASLDSGAVAVTPETQVVAESGVIIAKNVPLVMATKTFRRTGGYDTQYFAGLEDLDFTYQLLSTGHRIASLEARYHHFDGMSTTIMLHPRARELKDLYGLNMVPKAGVAEIKRASFQQLGFEINLVTARNMARFTGKYATYLAEHGHHDFLERARQLSELARRNARHPLVEGSQGLVALYRSRLDW